VSGFRDDPEFYQQKLDENDANAEAKARDEENSDELAERARRGMRRSGGVVGLEHGVHDLATQGVVGRQQVVTVGPGDEVRYLHDKYKVIGYSTRYDGHFVIEGVSRVECPRVKLSQLHAPDGRPVSGFREPGTFKYHLKCANDRIDDLEHELERLIAATGKRMDTLERERDEARAERDHMERQYHEQGPFVRLDDETIERVITELRFRIVKYWPVTVGDVLRELRDGKLGESS